MKYALEKMKMNIEITQDLIDKLTPCKTKSDNKVMLNYLDLEANKYRADLVFEMAALKIENRITGCGIDIDDQIRIEIIKNELTYYNMKIGMIKKMLNEFKGYEFDE